jgi:hypothetical protein
MFTACTTCTGISFYRLQSFGMWCQTGTVQSQSLWTSKFGDLSLATHFNTNVLTLCNWFQQIRTRMWLAIWFPHLPYDFADHNRIRQDVSFVNLAAFMLYGQDYILAISCILCFQKVCAFYYKSIFMLFKVIWYLWYCHLTCCWKKTGILYCKLFWIFMTVLPVPINHEHWDYTVPTVWRNPLLPFSLYKITILIFTTVRTESLVSHM